MADENEQDPKSGLPNQDEIDKRIEDFKRVVALGASEAQAATETGRQQGQ